METTLPSDAVEEIAAGRRFAFGRNWRHFLDNLDEERIGEAKAALAEFLGESLAGLSFLDAGSGSGLMSLSAHRLGATPVASFDFDPDSVACTEELRQRSGASTDAWSVRQGSLLDEGFLAGLGTFDVVYCWGVAHHTGSMWEALGNLTDRVNPGGRLFVAIYHDQGWRSRVWLRLKRAYVRGGRVSRSMLVVAAGFVIYGVRVPVIIGRAAGRLLRRGETSTASRTSGRPQRRGMSWWYDLIDWVGGYPFEVARPDEIERFYVERGFTLEVLQTSGGGLGCNQLVFRRSTEAGQ